MPSSGSAPVTLLDTSVAVALVVTDHEHHDTTFQALKQQRLGLAGHAAFETFSVLSRLPPPARRTPGAIARLLSSSFPDSRFLGATTAADLLAKLHELGIAGGAVYDALVGATAAEYGLTLVTRDRRALDTYRALEVQFELLP
jgi:predicted nucleic acid-binding protein